MKNIKKLLSIVMMLALVLSLGASAFAATVTLPQGAAGHDMVAYEIFKGSKNDDSLDNQLGVTDWGSAVPNPEAFLTAMANAYPSEFNAKMTAVDAAEAIQKLASANDASVNVALGNAIANAVKGNPSTPFVNNEANLEVGYWVIVDVTENLPENQSRSTVLLQVVGDEGYTLEDKIDQPTVEKKVSGEDDVVAGLGATLTFTLTAKLPSNYADFASYFLAFHDTMDAGLTFNGVTSVVLTHGTETVNADPIGEGVENGYLLAVPGTGTYTFDVTLANVKDIFPTAAASDTITVTYTATVNENAVVKNKNEVILDYSRDPAAPTEHGTTPPGSETVVVFTFDLDGTKVEPTGEVDEDGNPTYKPLEGASFTLYKTAESGEDVAGKKSVVYDGKTFYQYRGEVEATLNGDTGNYEFGFGQLGLGEYLLVETKVPAGYNKADDIYFQIVSTTETAPDGTQTVTGAQVVDKDGNPITNGASIDFDGTVDGTLDEQVINQNGLELPETGGIGTTIFYVVGAILVVGAVILLVTRKRMSGAAK